MLRQLTSAQAISELAAMIQGFLAEADCGERFEPPLSPAELAFYDAVAHRGMAELMVGGDETLAEIACALVADIRKDLSGGGNAPGPDAATGHQRTRPCRTRLDVDPQRFAARPLPMKRIESPRGPPTRTTGRDPVGLRSRTPRCTLARCTAAGGLCR
ncbi:type I restriction enzyme endonuclease domain-containing protein [Streptomyces sp. NPDC048436]|uniref:type I restriction enzyme endonuclease domain-containing protein n=1 Tax=Streptomyces sp. NPDC048436 TaxID=3365550 RepID=UPI0037111C1F